MKAEDLIEFGFESEFVGRLPVVAVFEHLTEEDLYQILKNPNNPIMLGKKLDFAAYGIAVKFEDAFLRRMAELAFAERTGARGLVSVIEKALLDFEKALPSSAAVTQFRVTLDVVTSAPARSSGFWQAPRTQQIRASSSSLADAERAEMRDYLQANRKQFTEKYSLTMTPARIDLAASCYTKNVMDSGSAVQTDQVLPRRHQERRALLLQEPRHQHRDRGGRHRFHHGDAAWNPPSRADVYRSSTAISSTV